ncbi:MAG TPA: hypothetical protein VGV38_18415 [Pyrinomonadaceae bacterium]|nr:hypothetical protein [Pyrinomonadaceae bacterium]
MNGKTGDHPITDLLLYNMHPFPSDMEEMIRKLHATNPDALHALGLEPFDWEEGKNLEQGRAQLRALLAQHGGDSSL